MEDGDEADARFVEGDEPYGKGLMDVYVEGVGALIEDYGLFVSTVFVCWSWSCELKLPAESMFMSMLGLRVLYHR